MYGGRAKETGKQKQLRMRISAVLLSALVLVIPVPVNAEPPTVNQLTARAVDKELELMQMSTNLKLQTAPLNQWRERRWFSYAFSNQVLTAIGTYINGCTRIQYRHHTGDAPKNAFVNSSWIRIIAYAIALAGCAAETANDLRIQRVENKAGLNLRSYLKHAKESLAAIDGLIKQRAELIDLEPNLETKEMLIRETRILTELRNSCADDLEESYIRAKSVRASRYFQYAYVGTSSIIGGAGTLANTIATIHDDPPNYLWPGGAGDTLTGAMNAVAPEAIRRAGNFGGRRAGHPLTAELTFDARDTVVNKLDADLENLRNSSGWQNQPEIAAHVPIYEVQGKILAQHFSSRPQPPKGTVGRVVGDFGALAGGTTKMSNGIETLVGAFKYPKDAHKRFENFGAGGIAYGVGMIVTAEETLRREVKSEIIWHRLPKVKRLKSILKAQLATLSRARDDLHLDSSP
ncbi:MAG: hypothetical protein JST89_01460 [Cyanobacteria bacterium SZAS-4]|nr:hypothetical protein [Cyanobacteria bacterium SZAS-4]